MKLTKLFLPIFTAFILCLGLCSCGASFDNNNSEIDNETSENDIMKVLPGKWKLTSINDQACDDNDSVFRTFDEEGNYIVCDVNQTKKNAIAETKSKFILNGNVLVDEYDVQSGKKTVHIKEEDVFVQISADSFTVEHTLYIDGVQDSKNNETYTKVEDIQRQVEEEEIEEK